MFNSAFQLYTLNLEFHMLLHQNITSALILTIPYTVLLTHFKNVYEHV